MSMDTSGNICGGDGIVPESSDNKEKVIGTMKTRVIELGDRNSRLALRRQLNLDFSSPDKSDNDKQSGKSEDRGSMEILQKLPPGTVLIKHLETKIPQEAVKSNDTLEKPKRISQRVRNKNCSSKIIEVRRNPMRVTKKEVEKNRASMRQRLLAVRRKNIVTSSETQKRSKHYMNTRSVTRKMYNVGATYQAPTKRDETEWKEWPIHGMHERPVYHPVIGLASEYNGRLFVSLNESYQEISTESNVEVVSVDPRPEMSERLCNKPSEMVTSTDSVKNGINKNSSSPCLSCSRTICLCPKLASNDGFKSPFGNYIQPIGKLVNICSIANNTNTVTLQSVPESSNNFNNLQHLEQLRNANKYYENLKKSLGSSLLFQNLEKATLANAKFIPTDVAMKIKNSNFFNLKPPSKCLILPRGTTINLPNIRNQLQSSLPGNTKNALILVKAPDSSKTAKPYISEKPATVTSSTMANLGNEVNLKIVKDTIKEESRLGIPKNYEKKQEESPFLKSDIDWMNTHNSIYGLQNSNPCLAVPVDRERQGQVRQFFENKNTSPANKILRLLTDINRGYNNRKVGCPELFRAGFPNQRRPEFGENGEFPMNLQDRLKVSDEFRHRDDDRNDVLSQKAYVVSNRGNYSQTTHETLPEALDLSKKESSRVQPTLSTHAMDFERTNANPPDEFESFVVSLEKKKNASRFEEGHKFS